MVLHLFENGVHLKKTFCPINTLLTLEIYITNVTNVLMYHYTSIRSGYYLLPTYSDGASAKVLLR